jgi:transcriptional regulator with GAF, ATPase, and Fis domain
MRDDPYDEAGFREFLLPRPADDRPLTARLTPSHGHAITRLMRRLIADLERYYPIEKAALAIYDRLRDRLCVSHLHYDGQFKTGLTLALPDRRSLMYQILQQGFPIADNYPQQITAGIVERKIILGERTRSVLIVPLIHDGDYLGVISLASPRESAFSLYLDGVGETMVARFVAELGNVLRETAGAG